MRLQNDNEERARVPVKRWEPYSGAEGAAGVQARG
jgi:hypothetical protein